MLLCMWICSLRTIRELKIYDATVAKTLLKIAQKFKFVHLDLRRDRSDNGTNFAYLMNQNKSFARPSRAFFISVYFFPVLGECAT